MIPHVGFCGRWPIGLSSSSLELGKGGFGAQSQFFRRSSCSYFCSVFRAVDRGIVETTIPGGKRKRGQGSGYSPIQREDGKGEGGYRRVDDTAVMDCWTDKVVLRNGEVATVGSRGCRKCDPSIVETTIQRG